MTSELEEQHEKLRREVDSWRCRSQEILRNLRGGSFSSARSHPIELHVEPLDRSSIKSLIHSENVDLAKFVMVLSYDCIEISRLRRHASRRLYRRLLMFGHRGSLEEIPLEGEPQKAVGQCISLFMDFYETVTRISAVLRNLLLQMNSLYSLQDKNSRPCLSLNSLSLQSLFAAFAEGMSTLLILEEILRQNTRIIGHMSQFRRMLMKTKLESDAFDISVEDLECLEEVVSQVEKLCDAGLFPKTFDGEFHLNDKLQKGSYSRKLIDSFTSWTHEGLKDLLPRLDTWKEHPSHRQRILQHIAVFIFVANAFDEAPEKKLGKTIADILRKAPVIYVEYGIRFNILELIEKRCPGLLSSWSSLRGTTKDCDLKLRNYLSYLTESHSREWQTIKNSTSCWLVSFLETTHPAGGFGLQLRQIIQGILLAGRIHTLVLSMMDLHSLLEVPIRREKFKALCHMVVLLKVIAESFCAKRMQLILCLPHVINLIQADIEGFLLPAKQHLEAEKGAQKSKIKILSLLTHGAKDAESKLTDSLSLALLSIHLLNGNGSLKRHQILSVTLDVLQSIGHADMDFIRIKKFMSKLSLVADFQSLIEELTDCSFLFWRKEMMKDWLNMVYIDDKISWLQYLLDAFCDGIRLLNLDNVSRKSLKSYKRQLEDDVTNEIIWPLCRDVENDLRLHVHSAFLKGSVNVNLTKTGVRNLSWYLQMRPLSLPFKFIEMRTLVESFLNSNFYNYTAMAQYDWKVYFEMRQLAELKYGLVLDNNNLHGLPPDSSGHGFDFTEIIKDILNFSRDYSYDLIKQIFVQKVDDGQQGKAPVVLGVDHVVSSIYTHGLTTANTLTERIITFLSEKMRNLSDLLEDDIFRSLLLKERSWKRDKENPKKYPFTRAEQLTATLEKLSSKDGDTRIIDQMYSIVTQIGNGLGLARLLFTGGSRHAHQIYGPSSVPMDGKSDEGNLNFDDVSHISHLLSSVTAELERSGGLHLEDFSFIIPALTLNLLVIRLLSKEKSMRRESDTRNHPLTDDGFFMGTIFILKVTGGDKLFKELHWFASADKHLEDSLTSLGHRGTEQLQKESRVFSLKLWTNQSPQPASPKSNKEIERLRRYQQEMRLVEYGFNTAGTIISYN